MINTTELRIGNYVLFNKQVIMVKGVAANAVMLEGVMYDTGNPNYPYEYKLVPASEASIQPIPLNDNILQKVCGRIPMNGGYAYKYYGARVTFLIYEDEEGYFIGMNYMDSVFHITPCHLQSFHQLQNVFFAQYGFEMDIDAIILRRCINNAVRDGLI